MYFVQESRRDVFGISSQKIRGKIFLQKVYKVDYFQDYEVDLWLVILKMRKSVSRNAIFSLKWRHYGPKGDILDYLGTVLFWFNIPFFLIK